MFLNPVSSVVQFGGMQVDRVKTCEQIGPTLAGDNDPRGNFNSTFEQLRFNYVSKGVKRCNICGQWSADTHLCIPAKYAYLDFKQMNLEVVLDTDTQIPECDDLKRGVFPRIRVKDFTALKDRRPDMYIVHRRKSKRTVYVNAATQTDPCDDEDNSEGKKQLAEHELAKLSFSDFDDSDDVDWYEYFMAVEREVFESEDSTIDLTLADEA